MNRKTVLVTGASRGIGRACAERFADAGYYVFLNCSRSLQELKNVQQNLLKKGCPCKLLPGDVGDPKAVQQIFDGISSVCPGLDVLVNNAGVAYSGLLQNMSDHDWETVIQTNLSSVFYCSRAAIPYMVRRGQGKIINISSMWGRAGASCEVAYSAAKAGVNGFTMALAKELAPSNIQVNAIACGIIDTAMNASFSEEERRCMKEEVPAGRFGSPQEVAALVLDLAANHPYMTGQVIGLDGGYI